jgi:hypothetical protein
MEKEGRLIDCMKFRHIFIQLIKNTDILNLWFYDITVMTVKISLQECGAAKSCEYGDDIPYCMVTASQKQ